MTSPFLALHAIHTVPASLLNRDENGAAKQITVDGTPRVRISSQAWKRAMRLHHREAFLADGGAALRTRRLARLVAEQLVDNHGADPDRATRAAASALDSIGLQANEKTGESKVLTFTSHEAPARIASVVAPHLDDDNLEALADNKELRANILAAFSVGDCIDLALYGRMLSDLLKDGGNVDGALQVAHPFSTHPGAIELDFFTAVDDAIGAGEPSSGHLATADLTAPTLYRYAALDRRQLRSNLTDAGDTDTTVARAEAAVIDDFIRSMPGAKVRSTAATTLPSLVLAVTGNNVYSAANAFSPAVQGRDVTAESARRLVAQVNRTAALTGDSVVALPLDATGDSVAEELTTVDSIDNLVKAIK